jgi:hypothetical protein
VLGAAPTRRWRPVDPVDPPVAVRTRRHRGPWLARGAAGETVAHRTLFARSDRRRVGLYAVLPATLAGLVGVGAGLLFVTGVPTATLVRTHLRANVLGVLGLTIVGLSYQFYPPAIGTTPGATDRTAFVSIARLAGGLGVEIARLAGGLGVEIAGAFAGTDPLVGVGEAFALLGAGLYAYLLASAFRTA